ncbi:hypothetical protein AX13_04230 [Comamonas aquatica DA1877]|uniref:Uncharacterized protein n=1 Tax=Comamonas aquatica DA1877 TaxID=1457173 RepID=A0A014MD58_9BURK|nr:hypothetical protein AX13_04230 [Comamonas aquatica DA1877]
MPFPMVFAQPLETGLESVQTIQESLLNKLLHTHWRAKSKQLIGVGMRWRSVEQ